MGNQIRVAAGVQIDFEARSSYAVTLTVTDKGGASRSEDLVIGVADVAETLPVSPDPSPVSPSPDPAPVLVGDGGNNTLTGTGGADAMSGGGGNDVVNSGDGADRLQGGDGNDTLLGGLGIDDLWGGKGRDTLTGGGGADSFIFTALTDSGPTKTTRDTITDFGGKDEIDLRAIDAVVGQKGNQAFELDRGGPFEAGEVRQSKVAGGLLLEMNVDRDARAEMSIFLKGVGSPLSDGDFVF